MRLKAKEDVRIIMCADLRQYLLKVSRTPFSRSTVFGSQPCQTRAFVPVHAPSFPKFKNLAAKQHYQRKILRFAQDDTLSEQ